MRENGLSNSVNLSGRLQMLADMVTTGNRLVDVGCDHGFLSIYLVDRGICPGALAMDVREGPLAAARMHIGECGLGGYIETRLSDGLGKFSSGEADTLVCAGMGGRLMEKILTEGMDKASELKELILQPQSELPEFRKFLRKANFRVIQEDAVLEEGKYYFAMKAVPGESGEFAGSKETARSGRTDRDRQQLYDLYGEMLLKGRHIVLSQYLEQRKRYLGQLEASLTSAGSRKAEARLEEVRSELGKIEQAQSFFLCKRNKIQ